MQLYIVISLLTVIIFAVSCFLGALISDCTLKVFNNGGLLPSLLINSVTIAAVGYAITNRARIQAWFKKVEFINTGEDFSARVEAIVIPVSRREQPEWIIRHLRPKIVALLYTKEKKSIAYQLVNDFSANVKFVSTLLEIENDENQILNPDNPLSTREVAKKYIKRFIAEGIEKKRMFVDTTGGKVPMSIGCFQAAEEEGISTIYISGTQTGGTIEDPENRSHGKAIFISDKT